jgi:hypothetical protein
VVMHGFLFNLQEWPSNMQHCEVCGLICQPLFKRLNLEKWILYIGRSCLVAIQSVCNAFEFFILCSPLQHLFCTLTWKHQSLFCTTACVLSSFLSSFLISFIVCLILYLHFLVWLHFMKVFYKVCVQSG